LLELYVKYVHLHLFGWRGGVKFMKNFKIDVTYKRSQVKANEVGGECGTHGRGEKSVQGFGGESPKERDHLEDQGVGGKIG
jgi:hypothetical protein